MAPKLRNFLQPLALPAVPSLALLLLRLIVGIAFLYHGWGKITNPFAWMGPDAQVPGFLQFLAALSEFGGGISLILGVLVPISMAGLTVTMAVAAHMHAIVRQDPFVAKGGGPSYELALCFLGIAVLFLTMGAGQYSIDAKIFGERRLNREI